MDPTQSQVNIQVEESNEVPPTGMESEPSKEIGLPNVGEYSESYFNKLREELFNLREKLGEEKLINRELREIKTKMLGQVEIYCQRMEELGMDHVHCMMAQAKEEMLKAKKETNDMNHELLATSLYSLNSIGKSVCVFEDLRIQYRSITSINQNISLELQLNQKLDETTADVKGRIKSKKNAIKELYSTYESFGNADFMLDNLLDDVEKTSQEIRILNYHLMDIPGYE